MLNFIRGTVVRTSGNKAILDVGGLGLELSATPSALAELRPGQPATLDATLVIREDNWQLFGFGSAAERALFDSLQTVSGVGPKLALTILSAIRADELAQAIASGDEARLVRIPGVGKKSAARLIVELADRLPQSAVAVATGWHSDVRTALVSLGWSDKDAEWAVKSVADELGNEAEPSDALRTALSKLGKR